MHSVSRYRYGHPVFCLSFLTWSDGPMFQDTLLLISYYKLKSLPFPYLRAFVLACVCLFFLFPRQRVVDLNGVLGGGFSARSHEEQQGQPGRAHNPVDRQRNAQGTASAIE